MASSPDVQAVRVRRAGRPEEDRAARERQGREEGELPGHQPRHERRLPARLDVEARDRARGDAGAHAAAVPVAPVHADRDLRPRQAGVPQLGPVRQPADDAGRGARPVVRHVLLPARLPVLSRGRPGPEPHAAVGAEVRLRRPDRVRPRRRAGRARADARLAEEGVQERLGPRLEPGELDPARRSASRTSR